MEERERESVDAPEHLSGEALAAPVSLSHTHSHMTDRVRVCERERERASERERERARERGYLGGEALATAPPPTLSLPRERTVVVPRIPEPPPAVRFPPMIFRSGFR